MIKGLSGFARSGKDEFAKHLVEKHGFIRVAFADKLRDFLYALNPLVSVWRDWDSEPGTVFVQDVIDRYGWDGYKESIYGVEVRRLLQRLGTEAGRQVLWDTIWIDSVLDGLEQGKNYVVTDARFINEFDAIARLGGYLVRVERAGVGPANDHASEMEALGYMDLFDFIVENDGTLEQYYDKVEQVYQTILRER